MKNEPIEHKLNMEIPFLKALAESCDFDNDEKNEYVSIYESIYLSLNEVLIESDVKPMVSPIQLRTEKILTESEVADTFMKYFKEPIYENFTLALTKKDIPEYDREAKIVSANLINNNIDIPVEIIYTYFLFERILLERMKEVFLPKGNFSSILDYVKTLDKTHFEVFDKSIDYHKEDFNSKLGKLIQMIGPKLYMKSIELNDDIKSNTEEINKIKGYVEQLKGSSTFVTKDDLDVEINKIKEDSENDGVKVEDILKN